MRRGSTVRISSRQGTTTAVPSPAWRSPVPGLIVSLDAARPAGPEPRQIHPRGRGDRVKKIRNAPNLNSMPSAFTSDGTRSNLGPHLSEVLQEIEHDRVDLVRALLLGPVRAVADHLDAQVRDPCAHRVGLFGLEDEVVLGGD